MFTGIIEEVGTVSRVQHSGNASFIEIQAKKVLEDVHLGDSIAVNGVCLTVTHFGGGVFRADVMNETLSRSSLGSLTNGSPVNLERAMAANGRFGGHMKSCPYQYLSLYELSVQRVTAVPEKARLVSHTAFFR